MVLGIVLVSISSVEFIQIEKDFKNGFSYYTELNEFMEEAFQYHFSTVYSAEETYNLFFQYYGRIKNRALIVKSGKADFKEDFIVLPSNITSNEKELADYKLVLSNRKVKGYLKKSAN